MIRGHPVFVLCVLALAMVLCATSQVSAMMNQSQNTSSPVMMTTADNNGGGSSVDIGDTQVSLSSLATLPATATMAILPTAETAFTANAPEESKAIANDRTVMISSPAIMPSFA